MMKYLSALLMTVVLSTNGLMAQEVMNLYPAAIPGAKPAPEDYKETTVMREGRGATVSKVTQPTLTIFKPEAGKANGTAVIICPGGGYSSLAMGHEGAEVGKRFSELGVTAFVLKYRLPSDAIMVDKSFGPLQDAQEAMYRIRKDAVKWGVDPAKIGIIGFSAGGHLASSLAVHYADVKIENKEGLSLRPDFAILIYPVISFTESAHAGSVKNLVGADATEAKKLYFSNDKAVNEQTPPTFMVHSNNDTTVPVENSMFFDLALSRAKVKAELHIYQGGGHGYGLRNRSANDDWFKSLENWMKQNQLL